MFPGEVGQILGGGGGRTGTCTYLLGTEPSPSGWETKLFSTMRSQVGSTSLSTKSKNSSTEPRYPTELTGVTNFTVAHLMSLCIHVP